MGQRATQRRLEGDESLAFRSHDGAREAMGDRGDQC
jgi:hypothetical protein